MNTGQMLITIGAIFLLSMVILSTNRGLLTTNTTMVENRYNIMAVSLGTSIIERATGLAFDKATDGAAITTTTPLTAATSLGIETGENRNNPEDFSDFDDYNCYKTNPKLDTLKIQGSNRQIIFQTFCVVQYVNENNPDQVTTSKTFHKKITVKVISPAQTDTVRLSTVYSYWYFR